MKKKEKLIDKGLKTMVKNLAKVQSEESIILSLKAVWKQQGLNKEQIEEAIKNAKKYFK